MASVTAASASLSPACTSARRSQSSSIVDCRSAIGRNATVAPVVRRLESVIPSDPPRVEATAEHAEHPMRAVTRQVAFEPGGWTAERRAKVAELFDGLAPTWHTHLQRPAATAPLSDAYERGDVPRGGVCVEVASGDGQNTAFLASQHDVVIAADLSMVMLQHAPTDVGHRLRADSGDLPCAAGSVDVAVLVNAFLFPTEIDRVLAPDGVLVWVNTAGDLTPIFLTTDDVLRAAAGRVGRRRVRGGLGDVGRAPPHTGEPAPLARRPARADRGHPRADAAGVRSLRGAGPAVGRAGRDGGRRPRRPRGRRRPHRLRRHLGHAARRAAVAARGRPPLGQAGRRRSRAPRPRRRQLPHGRLPGPVRGARPRPHPPRRPPHADREPRLVRAARLPTRRRARRLVRARRPSSIRSRS